MSDGHVTFTTEIPDVPDLDLDATIQREMTAEWGDPLNNGEYRIELRDDDPGGDHPPWGDAGAATVPYDGTLAHTFPDLYDGEQYSIRVRCQTQYVDGDWLAAEEITKLIAADAVAATPPTTSVALCWTDVSDFRGSYQLYRARDDYEYDDSPGRLIATVVDTAESATDDGAAPATDYDYTVRARTQWVYADATVTVTTDGIGLPDRSAPPTGWHAEVDHPSGTIKTVQILGDAMRRPAINGLPSVELSAPYADMWQSGALDDAPMRVWHGGERQPIDRLEHRSLEAGGDSKQTTLQGRGGTQLERRIQVDVDAQPTHELAEDLIIENTDYLVNVDNPQAGATNNVLLQQASTAAELQSAFGELPSDVPAEYDTDANLIRPLQSGWFQEASSATGVPNDAIVSDPEYNSGEAAALASGTYRVERMFTPAFDIPIENFRIAARIDNRDGDHVPFEVRLNDTVLESYPRDSMVNEHHWREFGNVTLSDLEAGTTYTVEIEPTSNQGNPLIVDAAWAGDVVWTDPTYDDQSTVSLLSGPELYPATGQARGRATRDAGRNRHGLRRGVRRRRERSARHWHRHQRHGRLRYGRLGDDSQPRLY